jgi:transposase
METKATRKRKKHAEEFKREAVRLLETRGERTVADIAASLGVAQNLLHAWKRKHGNAAEEVRRERGGETQEEEVKRLRREVTQLKQERDVLKNGLPRRRVSCSTRNSRSRSVTVPWKSDRLLFGAAGAR